MSASLAVLFPYSAVTDHVTVRVSVSFLSEQSEPLRGRWFWSYHIRIENDGADEVQLISRSWIITDGRGDRQRVQGDGVVGDQPVIAPGAAYDYVSGCPLDTANGSMEGSYNMVGANGRSFAVRIPLFSLTGPAVAR